MSKREYIKINPIDIENKSIGIRFPFNAGGVFYSTLTTAEQAKSNILNVLLTEPGERIFKPNFGVGLRNYIFENVPNRDELEERIKIQTERYIPQIEIEDVAVYKGRDSHNLNIEITYNVIPTNEENTIQVNISPDNLAGDVLGITNTGTSQGY